VKAHYGKEPVGLLVLKYVAEVQGMFESWGDARRFVKSKKEITAAVVQPLNPCEVIDLIHRAGGYAIWAHPFLSREPQRSDYFREFKKHGIDAIEADYNYHENGYWGPETNEDIEGIVRAFCKENGIAVSGGSDSHYPLRTYSDAAKTPFRPGDHGVTEEEVLALQALFKP
jgi:hypothetical protein